MTNRTKVAGKQANDDEPMTDPQRSRLGTLAEEAGLEVPAHLTKTQATELIDELEES
jgi:hypothetical protein